MRPLPYALADAPTERAATAEVFVNSPAKPVVLMLGSTEPMRWVVRRTAATAIAVAYISGPFKAVVEGLDDGTPLLHGSAGATVRPFGCQRTT